MELFPAIDLRDGKVVRLYQGDYDRQTTYAADPVAQAQSFAEAGASFVHVVDLDAARTGKLTHFAVLREICAKTSLTVQFGGGVRDEQTIRQLIDVGVQRIVLGTAALADWSWFDEIAHFSTLANKLVLGLDAKAGKLAVCGWEMTTQATPLQIAAKVSDWPLAGIVYTDIAVDGTLAGPNVETTGQLAQSTEVPVIASGGVGTLEHLYQIASLPLFGVIVGRALYENVFTIPQALAALNPTA
jgi:phosphoribosylformimino-5-aminoimidazole carboxamide ribotide isomerase